jgi:hypothetical protein
VVIGCSLKVPKGSASSFFANHLCKNHRSESYKEVHKQFDALNPNCTVPLCTEKARFEFSTCKLHADIVDSEDRAALSTAELRQKLVRACRLATFKSALNSKTGFYIGCTKNPATRAEAHRRLCGCKNFHIFFVGKNKDEVSRMERLAISPYPI